MMIKMLNLNMDKNKILWGIMLGAVTVAIVLIVTTMYCMTLEKENKLTKTGKDITKLIFNTSSYVTKYNVNVVSNKNSNKYCIEEEYTSNKNKENYENIKEKFKFVTSNELGEKIIYEVEENNLSISSSGQKSQYILSDYIVKKRNLLSLTTFTSLYNDVEQINSDSSIISCARIETEEYEDKTMYRIILNSNCNNCNICTEYADILKIGIGVTKFELIISNETGCPLEYLIYNKENIAYIDIIYEYFDFN